MPGRPTKRQKNSAAYDTSIFYELLKNNPRHFGSIIDSLHFDKKFGLYYSVIELNLGLITTWVTYYLLVEKYGDKATALAKASNLFGRGTNNTLILESLVARLNRLSDNRDIVSYLTQIEQAILAATVMIETSVTTFLGEFGKHPLAHFIAYDSSHYATFQQLVKSAALVDIVDYLAARHVELNQIKRYIEAELTKHNTQKLRDLKVLIDRSIDTPELCNLIRNNRKYGDAIISLEASKNQTLLTTDWSFSILSSAQGKHQTQLKF